MKKKALNAVLCICLAFLLFSCEGSLTERIDKILKMADGNIYIDSGWVTVDTSKVTEAMNQITSGETLQPSEDGTTTVSDKVQVKIESNGTEEEGSKLKVTIGANELTVDGAALKGENPTFAAPLADDKLKDLNTTLNDVLSSPQKADALVEELKKPVEDESSKHATQNTFALTAAIADTMAKDESIDQSVKDVLSDLSEMASAMTKPDATVTQSDVLSAQLVVGIASDIAALSTDETISEDDKAALTAKILDQADTMIKIANTESGSFDVTKIEGLMDILGSSSSKAVVNFSSDAIEQIVKYRPMLNGIAKDLFGYNGSFDEAKVNRIVACYKKAEIAQRLVFSNDDLRNAKEFDLTKTLNYAVAVAVSSLDGVKNVNDADGNPYTPASVLKELIDDNPWILADANGNFEAIDENTKLTIRDELKNAIMNSDNKLIENNKVLPKKTLMSQAQALDNVLVSIPSIPEGFSLVEKLERLYN